MTSAVRPHFPSIGYTLLIQCGFVEALSIAFFLRTPAGLRGGVIAPITALLLPFIALFDRGSLLEVLAYCSIPLLLLFASVILWLRYQKRVAAHIALGLFSLLSIVLVLGGM